MAVDPVLVTNPATGDVISSGPRPASPRRRRLGLLLAAALLLGGGTGRYLDERQRGVEFTALVHCAGLAESALHDSENRVTAMASYVRPSVESGPTLQVQRSLYQLIADQAASTEPAVGQAARRCQAVAVLPFHGAQRKARAAYLTSVWARDARLRATVADGSRALTDATQLTVLRNRAAAALSAAALDGHGRRAVTDVLPQR